jgi:hypothetical protein
MFIILSFTGYFFFLKLEKGNLWNMNKFLIKTGSPSLSIRKCVFDVTWLHKTHKQTMPTLLLVYWSLYEFSEVTVLIKYIWLF